MNAPSKKPACSRYQTVSAVIPDDRIPHNYRCENLRSYNHISLFLSHYASNMTHIKIFQTHVVQLNYIKRILYVAKEWRGFRISSISTDIKLNFTKHLNLILPNLSAVKSVQATNMTFASRVHFMQFSTECTDRHQSNHLLQSSTSNWAQRTRKLKIPKTCRQIYAKIISCSFVTESKLALQSGKRQAKH